MAEFGPVVVIVGVIALLFNFGVHKVEEGVYLNFKFLLSYTIFDFNLSFGSLKNFYLNLHKLRTI